MTEDSAPPAASAGPTNPAPHFSTTQPLGPPPPFPPHAYRDFVGGLPPYPQPMAGGVWYPGAPQTVMSAVANGFLLKPMRWGIPDFVITVALWFFFSLLASILALAAVGESGLATPSGPVFLLLIVLPWLGLAGWPIWVTKWKGNGPIRDLGITFRWSDLGWGLIYGVGALTVAVIIGAITTALFGEFDASIADTLGGLNTVVWLLIAAILIGIGAPIVEELAYRGLFFNALAKRGLPMWSVILITALGFSLMHMEPVRIPLLFGTGLILGIARWHRKSTSVAIVAHAVNNIPGALALLFIGS